MVPSKQLWTPDMYLRLLNATSFLIACFVVLGIGSLLSMNRYASELAFTALIASALGIAGLAKMRGVFRDLIQASSGMPLKQDEAVPLARPVPQATVRTTDTPASSIDVWEQIATGSGRKTAKTTASAPRESWTKNVDWEEWVGKKLLQKAGVLIVLIGMLVFLKYSFDNGWVDELGRVFVSSVAAGALLIAGEIFHRKYAKWSQGFTGGGLALLYITVWVAHVLYAAQLSSKYGIVVPAGVAFVLYSIITLIGALAAVRYRAQTVAWFTVLGGYLTPFLVDTPSPDFIALLLYLAVLAGGLILLAWHRKWRYLNIAGFVFTNLYLFGMVYPARAELGDMQQVVTASGFFLLFNVLPLLYQFRQKLHADIQDIALIVLNAVAVFLPVVDATGGWNSGFVGIICMILAAFYMVFSVMALNNRGEDDSLVNTYLVGTVILVAGALFAELEREWVAVGWAPLSLLLTFISTRLQRKGPWVCAVILLLGSLFCLGINMPIFTAGPEEIWHPFTSNWAIQSYVVFASIIGWILLSAKLPQTIFAQGSMASLQTILHSSLAAILFLSVTFEATRLDFDIDIVWTFAYIALGVLAIGIFFLTENTVWFVTALFVQMLALLFIFIFGEHSGMGIFVDDPIRPFVHPWSYLSVLALLATFAMMYVSQLKARTFIRGVSANTMLIIIAAAQVWVHVSVEINNLSHAFGWGMLTYERILSGWWIVYALAVLRYGVLKEQQKVATIGAALLAIPFLYNHARIIDGYPDRFVETIVWTALALGLSVAGLRSKNVKLLHFGMVYLALAAGIDMLCHLGDGNAGFIRSIWWAIAGLGTMVVGFVEHEKKMRQLAMVIFGATAIKLLVFDFSDLATPIRIGASIGTGFLMIGASYLYQRFDTMPVPVPEKTRQ